MEFFFKVTGLSVAVSSDLYPGPHACHDKIHVQFLNCCLCLVVMGSECGWGLEQGSNFQLEGLKIEF